MPPVGSYVSALSTMSDRRAGDGDAGVLLVCALANPRDDSPVVEAHRQLRAEVDDTPDALDDAHDVRRLAARGHKVEDARRAAVLGLPRRLENERVVQIPARARRRRRRSEEPAAVLGTA